jgi:hypothetical protein
LIVPKGSVLAPLAHLLRIFIEPSLHSLDEHALTTFCSYGDLRSYRQWEIMRSFWAWLAFFAGQYT